MVEQSNYNIFEIDWFKEILQEDGPIEKVDRPDQATIKAYRGKLPDYLLQFWADHGWCSWSNG